MLAAGAGFQLSLGLLAAILGPLVAAFALAWAMSRTQALSAWRSAAEGYQMQVSELTTRLNNAESSALELHAEVNRLTARPDYTVVSAQLDSIIEKIDETKGAVDALDQRWR